MMHATPLPPLADVEDLLRVWLPIIFGVIYLIAQMVGNLQEKARKAAPPRPKAEPPRGFGGGDAPAPGGAGPVAKPSTLEETLRREVEEFLKRAQGNPAGQAKQQPSPAPKPKPKPSPERPIQRRPVSTTPLPQQPSPRLGKLPPAPTPADRLPSRPLPVGQPIGTSIAQQTVEHMRGSQAIVQHAQQLGAEIAQADERMEEHLRGKFVHAISTLAPASPAGERRAAATSKAQELRALFTSPGGAKQMIIAAEILRRPEERW